MNWIGGEFYGLIIGGWSKQWEILRNLGDLTSTEEG